MWLMALQEYQENETITVEETEINQSVNIFGCKGATILIKGKVNAVNISMYLFLQLPAKEANGF